MPHSRHEVLIAASLWALRSGRLAESVSLHPRCWQWARNRWLSAIYETVGTALRDGPPGDAQALQCFLRWALGQIRPDCGCDLVDIPKDAWLTQTSWRPLLATAAHYGFLPVPAMPDRYRRRTDETALENLCGLWAVGPSTLYRYLEKGRQLLAGVLEANSLSGAQLMSLRDSVSRQVCQQMSPDERLAWHTEQGRLAHKLGNHGTAVWHFSQTNDGLLVLQIAQQSPIACARSPDSDIVLGMLRTENWSPWNRFHLALTFAAIWRARKRDQDENSAYIKALGIANDTGDKVMLGTVFSSLGKFHEARDPDRALACYESSIQNLRAASYVVESCDFPNLIETLVLSLIRLGWLLIRRSDPRAMVVLEEAQKIGLQQHLPCSILGQLEQAWGEYWRCVGEHKKALAHKHRALNLFEQIADQRSILTTFLNLSLIYGELRDFQRAIDYGNNVLNSIHLSSVDSEVVMATYGNLGVAYFWKSDYDMAIHCYREALTLATDNQMKAHQGTAHINLAEAYYKRFQQFGDESDERMGDHHADIVAHMGLETQSPRLQEAAKNLKLGVLGYQGTLFDNLLPEDFIAHFPLMAEVRRLRSQLAMPSTPMHQASLRLEITEAFLKMATAERNAVRSLIESHGLYELCERLDTLLHAWTQDETLASQLSGRWREQVGDWLTDSQRKAVLERLLAEGSLSKSSYGEAAEVSPATASKHLGLLADKGLLEQQGRGPATRYVLPSGQHSGSRDGAASTRSPGSVH